MEIVKIVCPKCKRKVRSDRSLTVTGYTIDNRAEYPKNTTLIGLANTTWDRIVAEALFVCPICGYETEVTLCC